MAMGIGKTVEFQSSPSVIHKRKEGNNRISCFEYQVRARKKASRFKGLNERRLSFSSGERSDWKLVGGKNLGDTM